MKTHFYDIESLENAFTLANFKPEEDMLDIYYLWDNDALDALTMQPDFVYQLMDYIHAKNDNFRGGIRLFNLRYSYANDHLAKTFGLSDSYLVNNPAITGSYPPEFRPVCDTDPDYDPDVHPYLMGYNSYNYDTTMLAMYFHEVYRIVRTGYDGKSAAQFVPTTGKQMREYNNELFLPRFKDHMFDRLRFTFNHKTHDWEASNNDPRSAIRKNMLMTGRHIDVARLNEKQAYVGLKRLLGMKGYQILESERFVKGQASLDSIEDFMELVAYNASDVVNLPGLFNDNTYKGGFELKLRLLQKYPELVYRQQNGVYAPDIRPQSVRRDRLCVDSSSAQFSSKALCPYGHLKDIPCVSFWYPSEMKAKELGVPRKNILDEAQKFFYSLFPQPELRAKFDVIYRYYKSIEGKNFNGSQSYFDDWYNKIGYQPAMSLSDIPAPEDANLIYYYADGTPSSCFANFSTGGIHGAEYNLDLYLYDLKKFRENEAEFQHVKELYPDPIDCKKAKKITMPDGSIVPASKFLKSGSTLKHAEYKDISDKCPKLFVKKSSSKTAKLDDKYTFTSADPAVHEDFCSYYPNLLRMLSAFYNEGLGYDRYAEIFEDKQKYGKLKKDKSLPAEKRAEYAIQQSGTKLILNSASGVADAAFDSSVRMNNNIISMRIIGQLFSWRIGQALAYAGARIISTNTDGLYSVLETKRNNEILARESASIGVEIEPEPAVLITKDTNNRLDLDESGSKITAASGGSLACRKGPDVTKSLDHPAAIDWALSEYLVAVFRSKNGLSMSSPFDDGLGMTILRSLSDHFEPVQVLNMFQNILASSTGSISYIFSTRENDPEPTILQHYNRVFIMKDGTPNTVQLHIANARKITPAAIKKRIRNNERLQQHDLLAAKVLTAHGIDVAALPSDKEAALKKIKNLEENWCMYICNKNLSYLPQEQIQFILNNLDYEKYLIILRKSFMDNWHNIVPGESIPEPADDDAA